MPANDYAIVVGITDYPNLESLKGPERDADAFYEWLLDAHGADVPMGNATRIVTSLYGPGPGITKPTADLIEEAFLNLVRLGRRNGGKLGRRLYIFFSGHGISPNLDLDDAALLMANAARDTPGLHIPGKVYVDAIALEGLFEEIVLFMDCCRDDYERVSSRQPPWVPAKSARGGDTKRVLGFATRWGRKAREKPIRDGQLLKPEQAADTDYRGVFTTALMEALKGHAAGENSKVTVARVSGYIHNRVKDFLEPDEFAKPEFHYGTDDLVLAEVQPQAPKPKQKSVTIHIQAAGTVDLIGPDAQVKKSFAPPGGTFSLDLDPGLYLLVEQGTSRQRGFQVMGEGEIDVEF